MRHQLARISLSRSFQNNNWTLFLNLYWHAKATMLTSKMIHQFRISICFVHVFVQIYQWCTWHLIYLKFVFPSITKVSLTHSWSKICFQLPQSRKRPLSRTWRCRNCSKYFCSFGKVGRVLSNPFEIKNFVHSPAVLILLLQVILWNSLHSDSSKSRSTE